ncbi:MAG TPA: methionyl-tRNA formyltransferase [Opitutaceae bacterium]|nr:methionyl-tRNA formyltransferase [Opitutaceae bacterium]
MKTLFIGSTRRGHLALEALLRAGLPVCGVLSLAQDAHESERFEERIRGLAAAHRVPLREVRALKDPGLPAWVRETGAEAGFAVGARTLMPAGLFGAFPRGCWAAHDSLLPRYRGFAPLNWAVINGEKETGVSLFRVEEGVDTGDILLQRKVAIGPDESAPQVYERVCQVTAELVVEGHRLLREDRAVPVPQDHAQATYGCSRTPADGWIDWGQPSEAIHNLIRGLTFPYPGAFTLHEGRRLFVLRSERLPQPPRYVGRIPGRVVKVGPDGSVEVLTGDGVLRLLEVSDDGSTPQPAATLVRSVRARLGAPAPTV